MERIYSNMRNKFPCSELLCYTKAVTQVHMSNVRKSPGKTYQLMDFAVPKDLGEKIKEGERIDKYLDLARELNKLWNIRVTVIPVVLGTLGIVSKGLEKPSSEN